MAGGDGGDGDGDDGDDDGDGDGDDDDDNGDSDDVGGRQASESADVTRMGMTGVCPNIWSLGDLKYLYKYYYWTSFVNIKVFSFFNTI